MGIGIDIRVNGTDKLREAKKEIGMLNNGLRESEQLSDITIQTSGLPNKNDTQGMVDGVRDYANQIDRARGSIAALVAEQRKLTSAVTPRMQQVAQESPQKEYLIKEYKYKKTEEPINIAPRTAQAAQERPPKLEQQEPPVIPQPVSPRTAQAAQDYYNTEASQATTMDAAKKLKEIDAEGSRKGGVITPGQAAEASRLYKLILDEQKKYEQEIARTGVKLDELFAKKHKLEQKAPLLRTEDEQKAVEQLRYQIDELAASSEKYQQTQDKTFDKTNRSATRSNQNIQGYRQQEDQAAAASMGSTIKKALGWALAAAGGFSLLGFLSSSRAQYQQAVGHEGKLYARGIKGGYNDGVSAGIGPLEQMQMLEGISQTTGMFGKKANSATNMAGRFAKFTGTDPSQVAGMYGTMYQATGNQLAGTGALSMMGEAIKKGMDKSRVSELMQLVSRNTQATAQAMGGAGSDRQAGQATALAIESMKAMQGKADYAQYAKSGNFQNVIQNGLQGAGTAAGDIRLFKAIGGYDGPMTFEKIHEMNKIRQGGFAENPQIMSQIIGSLHETTDKGRAGELETIMESWGIKGLASEKIIGMSKKDEKTGKSFFDRLEVALDGGKKKIGELSKGSAEDKRIYAEWQKAIGKNPATAKEALEATRQKGHIAAGDALSKAFYKLENAALKAAAAITNSKAADAAIKTGQWLGDAALGNPNTAAAVVGGTVAAVGFWKFGKYFKKGSKLPPGVTATGETVGAAAETFGGSNATRAATYAEEMLSVTGEKIGTSAPSMFSRFAKPALKFLGGRFGGVATDLVAPSEAGNIGDDAIVRLFNSDPAASKKLQQVSPKIRAQVAAAIIKIKAEYEKRGLKLTYGDALRSVEDEQKAIKSGKSKLKDPRNSKHVADANGYSGAIDVYPTKNGKIVKMDKELAEIQKKAIADSGLGGGWDWDPGHIEDKQPKSKTDSRVDTKMSEAGALGDMIANTINGVMERIFKLPTDYLKQIADNTTVRHSIPAQAPRIGKN
jgi:plasmid maintenance system antidote protein VapI